MTLISVPMQTELPLPRSIANCVRLIPGNDKCADCEACCPQWSSVSFGILICLVCAGKHRALGVSISFVKSLELDSWTKLERVSIEIGGNAKWNEFCLGCSIDNLSFTKKYHSEYAKSYRQRITLIANHLARPERAATFAVQFGQLADRESSDHLPVENSLEERFGRQLASRNFGISSSKHCSRNQVWKKYERELGVQGQALGFTLAKTKGGFAEVNKVTKGGEADILDVSVGSFIVAINGHKIATYDEIVEMIKSTPRPIRFRFVRRKVDNDVGAPQQHTSNLMPDSITS
uniref:Uncharacterized protein AlNc14C22G2286 n=1 Tax=Albugo laibachii Nc14 TaxID=890382 RepID=F0W5X8_9STRA|nr:conserved hypothetical protein [Albugo laibachii Nc14]|eukprot:CCA16519.1 conserved hypothetical protein [Albugo laibachii Nc14]